MKSNHQVKVVRIADILKHPNADSLSLIKIDGYQAVVKTEAWKVGDNGIYIQPDSVVPVTEPFKFLWEGRVPEGEEVPLKYRRVTARRFRKEWSEGLLLPFNDFFGPGCIINCDNPKKFSLPVEGDDVSELLGITHYEPPEPDEVAVTRGEQYKKWPKSIKGWFYFILHHLRLKRDPLRGKYNRGPKNPPPIYDVEAFKNFPNVFEEGEPVIVTEKIHGSNARYLFDGKTFWVGSRKLWKAEDSNCVWRQATAQNPWIEMWCRDHPNHTLFGEVTPTQKGYNYGCQNGRVRFFAFSIYTPSGAYRPAACVADRVPVLYEGPFNQDILKQVDGPSHVDGAKHIREGLVIEALNQRRVRGLDRVQLKVVSNLFLSKE